MKRIASRRPETTEYVFDYHKQLIDAVAGDCVFPTLETQMFWLCELASHLSTEQVDKVDPPYGWTIRQVFEHCADAERVFGYRMLRIAAGDETALPGWDENAYAASRFGLGNFGSLVAEIGSLRQANVYLLRRICATLLGPRGRRRWPPGDCSSHRLDCGGASSTSSRNRRAAMRDSSRQINAPGGCSRHGVTRRNHNQPADIARRRYRPTPISPDADILRRRYSSTLGYNACPHSCPNPLATPCVNES